MTNILLICREGKSRQVYQAQLDLPGVSLVSVSALMEFFCHGIYCPVNGILVDMPTYMRSDEDEKRLLAELVVIFPALRLKCHELTGEVRTLPFGTVCQGNISPAFFLQEYCAPFVQRKIRTGERSLLNMPALLGLHLPVSNCSGARSVAINISCGGCFLVCFEPWLVGERGWLVLSELQDSVPISVEVRFVMMWGEGRALPGMGVKFIELSGTQKTELGCLDGRSFMAE